MISTNKIKVYKYFLIQSLVERGNSTPNATGLRMHFLINLNF